MTVELIGEHKEIAAEARERIRARIMGPLAQAADLAQEILPAQSSEDSTY